MAVLGVLGHEKDARGPINRPRRKPSWTPRQLSPGVRCSGDVAQTAQNADSISRRQSRQDSQRQLFGRRIGDERCQRGAVKAGQPLRQQQVESLALLEAKNTPGQCLNVIVRRELLRDRHGTHGAAPAGLCQPGAQCIARVGRETLI